MRTALRALVVLAAACGAAAAARAESGEPQLQPYQLVRSLQILQDRIADGDHAALPLQKKMLELVDERLRAAGDQAFKQERNIRAALVYGMSGGNPATLAAVLRRTVVSKEDKTIGQGVLAYVAGDSDVARAALADVDATKYPAEIGAFLALIKGSVTSKTDARQALRQFDLARLMGPGTLVEEAALRRSLALEAFLKEPDRFFMAAEQYARRFLRSPYASQFADSLVSGVLELHADADLERLDRITRLMDADQRKVIYLRLARRATIDGLTELSAFAAKQAEGTAAAPDTRAKLYSGLSDLTSENIDQVASSLRGIDRQQLSESDIKLLEAAQAVMSQMTSPPKAASGDAQREEPAPPGPDAEQAGAAHAGAETADTAPAEKAEDAAAHPIAEDVAATKKVEPAQAGTTLGDKDIAAQSADGTATSAGAASSKVDDVTDMVKATRAKLSAIDELLETSK